MYVHDKQKITLVEELKLCKKVEWRQRVSEATVPRSMLLSSYLLSAQQVLQLPSTSITCMTKFLRFNKSTM